MITRLWLIQLAVFWPALVQAAAAPETNPKSDAPTGAEFQIQQKSNRLNALDVIRRFEAEPEPSYRLGAGDEITVEIWGRPELSGKHVVGPDGMVSLPLVGSLAVAGLSREEAPPAIAKLYSPYYKDPGVVVRVDRYASYRVYVLGRVANPGGLQYESQPTLLDVITRAGGLPIGGAGAEKAALSRCAIFRGREQVLWVDLKQILSEGNTAYNIRLRRNDVVYIPDSDDQLVYVLGESQHPGAFHLTPSMSLMDAIALAGGLTENASQKQIYLVRPRKQARFVLDLKEVLASRTNPAIQLEEGDIVFIPRSALGSFGLLMQKVSPLTSFAIVGSVLK